VVDAERVAHFAEATHARTSLARGELVAEMTAPSKVPLRSRCRIENQPDASIQERLLSSSESGPVASGKLSKPPKPTLSMVW
jgi:hypothetical protein